MTRDPIDPEDRLAIGDLLASYCHAMDASRADLCIRLFAADAVLETPVGAATGRDAILAWIEGRLALRPKGFQVGHYLLNPLFARVDAERIRARSMLLYTRQSTEPEGRSELLSTGIYEDEAIDNGLAYLETHAMPGKSSPSRSHYFYGQYYAVQAMYLAGDNHWAQWWPAVREELVVAQNDDGSWDDRSVGPPY